MKTKKSILFLFISLLTIGFSGCLGDGDNKERQEIRGIVHYEGTSLILKTNHPYWGTIYVPGLASQDPFISEGTCIAAIVEVDFDDRSGGTKYYTGQVLDWIKIDRSYLEITNDVSTMYNDTIDAISLPAFIDKVVFLQAIYQKGKSDSRYSYQLVCNTDSIKDGIHSLYFNSYMDEGSGSTSILAKDAAFDISSFIYQYGRDTTVSQVDYTYIKFYLNYPKNKDKDGELIYSVANDGKPVELFTPKSTN